MTRLLEKRGSEPDPRSILIVDDDETFRSRLARAFSERGLEVRVAASGDDAVVLASEDPPELAVVDLRMPGVLVGSELVRALKEIEPSMQIVVLTGYGSIASALDAVRAGAVGYRTKPATPDDLLGEFSQTKEPMSDAGEVPTLARVEWEHIHRVLHDCGGNISSAARLLGIHRRSLQRKLSKYPVRR